MMTREHAVRFANEWAAAWNARDLDRVLAPYRDDCEMTSPFIARLMDESSGTLSGKEQVRAYWRRALDRMPGLRFEILEVFAGVDSLVIHYNAVLGLRGCEVLYFDGEGKVSKTTAHYDRREQANRVSRPVAAIHREPVTDWSEETPTIGGITQNSAILATLTAG